MIRITCITLCLLLAPLMMRAGVPVMSLDALQERWSAGGDTVFVVNFWATWCKPCVAELPWFEKVHQSMHAGSPIRVMLVSLDTPKDLDKVERFLRTKGITADVVIMNERKPHLWIDRIDSTWSGAIPATLLLHAASARRVFHEREFTYNELITAIEAFRKDLP